MAVWQGCSLYCCVGFWLKCGLDAGCIFSGCLAAVILDDWWEVVVRHWLVSRHEGALEWARSAGIRVDVCVSHLSLDEVVPGDVVFGILPLFLAQAVLARGARFVSLEVAVPFELRGQELSAQQLRDLGAYWVEYSAIVGRRLGDVLEFA